MNYQELIERLRQYNGLVECRVQHPKTGNYCVSFDWHNSFNPKRGADEWLADQKKRFPENEYSTTYVVKEVCVLSKQDEACHESANAIESLLAENGRLKSESDEWEANSNQWEQEYYKKDAELAKYRDAPVAELRKELERECCGTFFRTPHRSTCQNYRVSGFSGGRIVVQSSK